MGNMLNRRKFIAQAALSGSLFSLVSCSLPKNEPVSLESTEKVKPLNILLLGGTSFLGPHQIK